MNRFFGGGGTSPIRNAPYTGELILEPSRAEPHGKQWRIRLGSPEFDSARLFI
ncbi:hypothetical protein J6590_105268, partial [Homalodisca vitripennis]